MIRRLVVDSIKCGRKRIETTRTILQGLVDYEGGDSDEEDDDAGGGEAAKRPRLS